MIPGNDYPKRLSTIITNNVYYIRTSVLYYDLVIGALRWQYVLKIERRISAFARQISAISLGTLPRNRRPWKASGRPARPLPLQEKEVPSLDGRRIRGEGAFGQ